MRKGNRLLLTACGLLALMTVVLLALISLFQVRGLTVIQQTTEIGYQSETTDMMTFSFSYLTDASQKAEVTHVQLIARDFPVYITGSMTRSFGPFRVTTLQLVIAPMETDWPEEGGIDVSDAVLTFDDGTTQQIDFGDLKLIPTLDNSGPFEITEMTSESDGSFLVRLQATKMLHFASISSTVLSDVQSVLELTINDKPVEEWRGLLVPEGEIVIQGRFVPDSVPQLQTMRLTPTIILEDEKGTEYALQLTTERQRQEDFTVFNLLSYTKKGGSGG